MPEELPMTDGGDTHLQIPLGILLFQNEGIARQECCKGDEMLLGHGMICGNEVVVLDLLHRKFFVIRSFLGLRGGKHSPAAGDFRLLHGKEQIPANGANIKLCFFHYIHFFQNSLYFLFGRNKENVNKRTY